MTFNRNSPKMKALDRKAAEIINKELILKEMIFQHFIRFEEFEGIPVGLLKRHSEIIGGMVMNTTYRLDNEPIDYKLVTDADANDEYYFRSMIITGIESIKDSGSKE